MFRLVPAGPVATPLVVAPLPGLTFFIICNTSDPDNDCSYAATNDYTVGLLPGIGIVTAADAVQSFFEANPDGAADPKGVTAALKAVAKYLTTKMDRRKTHQAGDYDAEVKVLLQAAYGTNLSGLGDHGAVHTVLELSRAMYCCGAVVDDTKRAVVHAIDPELLGFTTLSKRDLKKICGVAVFTRVNIADYTAGKLDPRTMKSWETSTTYTKPTTDDPSLHRASKMTSLAAQASSTVPAPSADDTAPDTSKWTRDKLEKWHKDRGQSLIGEGGNAMKKAQLVESVKVICEMGLGGLKAADIAAETAARYKADTAAWAEFDLIKKGGTAVDLDSPKELRFVPALQEKMIEAKMAESFANTNRNRSLGVERHVAKLTMLPGGVETEVAGTSVKLRRVSFSANVSESYPGSCAGTLEKSMMAAGTKGRNVVVSMLVVASGAKGFGGEAVGGLSMNCIVPRDQLEADADGSGNGKVVQKKGRRLCRNSNGSCVHARAVFEAISSCKPCGVDGQNIWLKKKAVSRSYDKDSFAHTLPVQGHPDYQQKQAKRKSLNAFGDADSDEVDLEAAANHDSAQDGWDNRPGGKKKKRKRRSMNSSRRFDDIDSVFSDGKLKEIDLGVAKSSVYRPALDKLLEVQRQVRDKKAVGKRSMMQGRKFKVETILAEVEGCECKWNPRERKWDKVCTVCAGVKAVYPYDRGLSRTGMFLAKNIECYIPTRKAKNQAAWSLDTNISDRAIATERINIERGNRSMRSFSSFDAQITLGNINLAHWEGQAVRGLVNLDCNLVDWGVRGLGDGVTISLAAEE